MCLIILTLTIKVFVFTRKKLLETVDEQADATTEVSEIASYHQVRYMRSN